jgi:Flp pilus assembly protein TadB
LDATTLVELQAALLGGASAAEALCAACGEGPLAGVARDVRLGRSLGEVVAAAQALEPGADLLVRALALAERTGAGAAEAVDHALDAIRAEADLARLLQVRTAQARGTAVILSAIPVATWLLLVAAGGGALGFYATPAGVFTAVAAVALGGSSWLWMRRLIAAAGDAADAADPLAPPPPPPRWSRAAAPAVCALALGGLALGPVAGVLAAVVVGAALARPRRRHATPSHAADTIDLVAVALTTGLPVGAALDEVARIAPPAPRQALRAVTGRLAGGMRLADAFAGTPLEPLGAVLAAGQRWGAPAERGLRRLSEQLRADRQAAAEVAAERLQLTLVFPTTLLTLPAFVLGVVPPLLWTTLQR